MYQSIIRDPGGEGLIRIQPDICGQHTTVVNGSILIVPPGTTAFVAINGILTHPYGPGRYEILTGVDPFFVRLRNALTHGDSGTSVSVFFVATEKSKFIKLGTGEFPFREHRFNLTMKALASCNLSVSIVDPLKVLRKLVGSYSSAFSCDDIDPCIEQMVLSPVREALSKEIGKLDVTEFNSKLSHIGSLATPTIKTGLFEYGIKLERFDIAAINIPETEISRLKALEQEYASGKTRTDIELDNLQRVWNGNVSNRTLSEMMTGIPSRGQAPFSGNSNAPCSNTGGMASMMMEMMMLTQMFPKLQEPISEMARHTDMFGNSSNSAQENTSSADSPPPMPNRYKRCPSCNGNVTRNNSVCPICGYRFNERND